MLNSVVIHVYTYVMYIAGCAIRVTMSHIYVYIHSVSGFISWSNILVLGITDEDPQGRNV